MGVQEYHDLPENSLSIAQPVEIFFVRFSPMPSISRSRAGDCSITSKTPTESLSARINGPDALHHAGAEVAFDASKGWEARF